jgi:hypothetical protein
VRFYGEQSTYFPTLSVVGNDLGEGAVAALAGDLFNWRAFACCDCIDAAQVTNAKLQLGKTFYLSLGGEGASSRLLGVPHKTVVQRDTGIGFEGQSKGGTGLALRCRRPGPARE